MAKSVYDTAININQLRKLQKDLRTLEYVQIINQLFYRLYINFLQDSISNSKHVGKEHTKKKGKR